MRRIIVSTSLVFSLAVFVNVRAAESSAASKARVGKDKTTAVVSYGNSDSMTEEEMKIYDYFLASDPLEGRNLPSRGYDTAALYVASHLAEWGLKPGAARRIRMVRCNRISCPSNCWANKLLPRRARLR